MCEYAALPLVKWYSTSDLSGELPGLTCVKVEGKAPSSSWSSWAGFYKILRLIDAFPW